MAQKSPYFRRPDTTNRDLARLKKTTQASKQATNQSAFSNSAGAISQLICTANHQVVIVTPATDSLQPDLLHL